MTRPSGNLAYKRRATAGVRLVHSQRTPTLEAGELVMTCWCERHMYAVPAQMVRDGEAPSCGRPSCQAPA